MGDNCTQCSAFNPTAGMYTPEFARGKLSPLLAHPCTNSTTNSTADCCRYDPFTDNCGLFYFDQFTHPCALCTDEDIPVPTVGLCNYCNESYPDATMGEIIGNSSRIEELTQHECAYQNNGVTSNCCLFDATTGDCGIFTNDTFAFPCGSCSAPTGTRAMSQNTIYGLVGGSAAFLVGFGVYFCWKRCHYKNVPRSATITINNQNANSGIVVAVEPTAIPVGASADESEAAPIVYAEVVDLPQPVPVPWMK